MSATVIEWLFFFFTTLQGVAIFLAHCVLNREVDGVRDRGGGGGAFLFLLQVRSSFLKAIGRRDLANTQQSMVSAGRRFSTAVGPSRFLRRKSSQFSGSLAVRPHVCTVRYELLYIPHRLEDSRLMKPLSSEGDQSVIMDTCSVSWVL